MLRHEKQEARRHRWSLKLMLCIPLVLVAVANGATLDKGVSKQPSSQEISFADQFEAEQRLADLGYWTGPVDGNFDGASRHALTAFQKVEGRQRTGRLTTDELQGLRSATRPLSRHTGDAHIEIDLRRQVLFIVDGSGSITHVLPVCTGNEKFYVDHGQVHRAHTPTGRFKVLRKISGWRLSSLGLLYYPNYIHEGIAIHGSPAVAVYPASHGCIRIPMFAAKEFSELIPIGTEVIVYDDHGGEL
jgi:L,D-transpeptidase catalytic domain/Putative peptidoglycan binding domain